MLETINKIQNNYARCFGKLYEKTPKAVFAAIAFSHHSNGGEMDNMDAIESFLNEWQILHQNGIVPQKPPTKRMEGGEYI